MTNKNLLETLTILERYVDPDDRNFQCSRHKFFMCVDIEDIDTQDLVRLKELGYIEEDGGLVANVSC